MYMKAAGMYSAIQGTCFNVLEVGTPVYRVYPEVHIGGWV